MDRSLRCPSSKRLFLVKLATAIAHDVAQELRRDLGRDVLVEEVADPVPLGQALAHPVERGGELADLVLAVQLEPLAVVAARDDLRVLREGDERPAEVAGERRGDERRRRERGQEEQQEEPLQQPGGAELGLERALERDRRAPRRDEGKEGPVGGDVGLAAHGHVLDPRVQRGRGHRDRLGLGQRRLDGHHLAGEAVVERDVELGVLL